MHTHTHTYTHTSTHTHTNTHAYIHTDAHTYTHTHTPTRTIARIHSRTHSHTHTHTDRQRNGKAPFYRQNLSDLSKNVFILPAQCIAWSLLWVQLRLPNSQTLQKSNSKLNALQTSCSNHIWPEPSLLPLVTPPLSIFQHQKTTQNTGSINVIITTAKSTIVLAGASRRFIDTRS